MIVTILSILFLSSFGVVSFQLYQTLEEPLKRYYWPFLGLKLLCAVLVGGLYQSYYQGGDCTLVMRDVDTLESLASRDFSHYLRIIFYGDTDEWVNANLFYNYEPRTYFFVRSTSILNWFSFGSFWGIGVSLSMISFTSIVLFFKGLKKLQGHVPVYVTLGFLLPSTVFWLSGFTKESMAFSAMLFSAYFAILLVKERKIWASVLVLLFGLIAFKIKYYVVVPFGVGFVLYLWNSLKGKEAKWWSYILISAVLAGASISLHPNLHWDRFYIAVLESNGLVADKSSEINGGPFPLLGESWYWMVLYAPKAIVMSVFRPFLWEATNWLQVLQALEKIVLLVLTLIALFIVVKDRVKWHFKAYVVLGFVSLLAVVIAYSVPNFGSMSRYAAMYLPFYCCLILAPLFPEKV